MKTEDIVTTILMRERHRRDRMEYLIRISALVCALLVMVVGSGIVLAMRGPVMRFIMTDATGKVLTLTPLRQPNRTDDEVAAWTVDSVTRIFTFDFANYRRQFELAQTVLTSSGWNGFQKMLIDSGNFNAVVANRFVTTASPSGSAKAKVLSSTLLRDPSGNERWGWVVEFPMVILLQNQKQQTSLNLTVKAIVVRMPEYINQQGLGIRQIQAR